MDEKIKNKLQAAMSGKDTVGKEYPAGTSNSRKGDKSAFPPGTSSERRTAAKPAWKGKK